MKLATLRTAFGTSAIRIEGDNVGVELDYEDVGALLRSEDWRKAAQLSGEPIVFDQHDLEAVVPTPGKIICVGLNYAKHIREMGRDFPEHPTLFIKFADALTGPFDDVYIPEYATQKLDYEGELAVVIGERTHRVTRADALDYVAGYSIMNDYTLRDYAKLKKMTSELVGRYVGVTIGATSEANAELISANTLGRMHGDLHVPPLAQAEVKLLKTIAVLYVMDEPAHLARQDRQRERIYRVYDYLVAGAPGSLDATFRLWWEQADTDAARDRAIIDQIASMTESRLERLARRSADLSGFLD